MHQPIHQKSNFYHTVSTYLIPLAVFAVALLPRVTDLNVFLTADEDDQIMFASLFLKSTLEGDPSNALVLGYPGVPTLALGAMGVGLRYALHYADLLPLPWVTADLMTTLEETTRQFGIFTHPLDFILWVRLPMVIMAAFCVMIIYLLSRRLLNRTLALVGTLMIAFDPFILAHTRVIHVDAPLAYFMFIAFLAFMVYLVEGHWRFLVASGLFAGLAALSKTGPSVFLGPILLMGGLFYVKLYPCPSEQMRRRYWRRLFIALFGCGLMGGLAFFALWPTMWNQPTQAISWIIKNLQAVNQAAHPTTGVFWGGGVTDQSPFYYLVVFPYHLTPLVTIGLLASLMMLAVGLRRYWQNLPFKFARELPLALSLLSYLILFIAPVSLVSRRGDRYILPVYFAAALLAVIGLWWLIGFIYQQISNVDGSGSARMRSLFRPQLFHRPYLLSSIVALQIANTLVYSPYYLSYYNPLLGGGEAAAHRLNIGWGEGLDQAARYLNNNNDGQTKQVAAWYSNQFAPFYDGYTVDLSDQTSALYSDYTVFYLNQVQRGFPSAEILDYFRQREPLHVVSLGGVDYAWIYEGPVVSSMPQQSYTFEVGHLFGGGADLLGVDAPTHLVADTYEHPSLENSEAAPPIFGEDVPGIPITLHWKTVNKIHGEHNVYIRLVDEDGQGWGQVDRLILAGLWRPDRWRPGFNVQDEYRLPLDAGTPPGTYHLEVGLYDFETGDTYGVVKNIGQINVTAPETPTPMTQLLPDTTLARPLNSDLTFVDHTYQDMTIVPGAEVRGKIFWQLHQASEQKYRAQFWLQLPDSPADPTHTIQRASDLSRSGGLAAPAPSARLALKPPNIVGNRYIIHETDISPRHPISTWRAGDLFGVGYRFWASPYAPAGDYPLMVSIIDPKTGETIGPNIELAEITVQAIERNYHLPDEVTHLSATLGNEIELVGFKLHDEHVTVEDSFQLSLYWRSLRPAQANYTVFIHAIGPDGVMRGQWDSMPVQGSSATSGWLPGEIIEDTHNVPLQKDAPAWKYDLFVGLYDAETGQRLSAYSLDSPISDNRIWLEQVQVLMPTE